MRIISKSRLRDFWQSRKIDGKIAERDFSAWHKLAEKVTWRNFAELKQSFGSADQVGNCVVFDVGNNRFRLIARVMYDKGIVYLLKAMDHAEYDKDTWAKDCGCHQPPPKREQPPKTGQAPRRPKKKR